MIKKLELLFDEHLRPSLAAHSGNVEIIDLDNDKLFVRLQGGCQGCSSSKETLKNGIQALTLEHFPTITEVIDLTDHISGENPYM